MKFVKLNNGIEMPILGFGVYQIPREETKYSTRQRSAIVGLILRRVILTKRKLAKQSANAASTAKSYLSRRRFGLITTAMRIAKSPSPNHQKNYKRNILTSSCCINLSQIIMAPIARSKNYTKKARFAPSACRTFILTAQPTSAYSNAKSSPR